MAQPANFRYDINGLRAIAILGVLLFHYKVAGFEGGFAGVDAFFVISGYLMSRTVMGQVAKGSFIFIEYFTRRLQRIVPALLFMIAVVCGACFFFYFPNDYKAVLNNGSASVLFMSNIYYWLNAPSYFDPSTDTNMFLHTWSLAAEWQFYIVYPFMLLLFNRLFKKVAVYRSVFTGLTVLSFVTALVVWQYDGSAAFYLLPTRAWEMMAGGLAFFAEGRIKTIWAQRGTAITGYGMVLAGYFIFDEQLPWPGFYTLVPVVGTLLIIIANYNNFSVIKLGVFQFIGKISYSLYLWHWPVYVIAQYYGLGTGWKMVLAYCALSGILAYLSYRYIESITFAKNRHIHFGAAALFVVFFSLGYFNANSALFDPKALKMAGYQLKLKPFQKQFMRGVCFVEDAKILNKATCLCFDDTKPNILIIGDSHAAQFSQSLREGFPGVHFLQATAPATLPTLTSYYSKKNNVRPLMDFMYDDFIPKNAAKIDGVVLTANWAGQRIVAPEDILKGLNEALAYFKKHNIPVVVIGQTERYTVPYPVVLARNYTGEGGVIFYLEPYTQQIDALLRNRLKGNYVELMRRPYKRMSTQGEPYMRDKDHLTKFGADQAVEWIKQDTVWQGFYNATEKH
ncbi:acyltransferase family protein [Flavobacterium akiainvivens]|uniref:acyltransferase family protein n=1 Tax=Flavobacterium akiainvivens TaxID=1202724 RepID=UPI0006C8E234|nr:acyltransferase family protein [Flavobacterium akiainvivens]SFQ15450.1 Peptidoglycan/LPS O-acetylase OafA/YrhL, contains acyltransferase and SGNH-hydrolase domains [Flavobacterium akiainvivens]